MRRLQKGDHVAQLTKAKDGPAYLLYVVTKVWGGNISCTMVTDMGGHVEFTHTVSESDQLHEDRHPTWKRVPLKSLNEALGDILA